MSIGGLSGRIQQVLSSGVDSIAEGVSKASQQGGIAAIQDAVQLFAGEGVKSFGSVGSQDLQQSAIAAAGYLVAPHQFFTKASLVPDQATGNFKASELASKLQDPKLDLQTQLKGLQSNIQEKLNTVGDDAQLSNVDLQNILQKQQQTDQMLSNLTKMLYDTASAITRKIGG